MRQREREFAQTVESKQGEVAHINSQTFEYFEYLMGVEFFNIRCNYHHPLHQTLGCGKNKCIQIKLALNQATALAVPLEKINGELNNHFLNC